MKKTSEAEKKANKKTEKAEKKANKKTEKAEKKANKKTEKAKKKANKKVAKAKKKARKVGNNVVSNLQILIVLLTVYGVVFLVVSIISAIIAKNSLTSSSNNNITFFSEFTKQFGVIIDKNTSTVVSIPFTIVSLWISVTALLRSTSSQQFSQKYSLFSNLSGYGIDSAFVYNLNGFLNNTVQKEAISVESIACDAICKKLEEFNHSNSTYFVLLKMKAISSLYLDIELDNIKFFDFGSPLNNPNYSQIILKEVDENAIKELKIHPIDFITFSDLNTKQNNTNCVDDNSTYFLIPFECDDEYSTDYFSKIHKQSKTEKYFRCLIHFKLEYYENTNAKLFNELEPAWLAVNILNKERSFRILNNFISEDIKIES